MEESLSKFMAESAKRHDEKSNLIKEIRASMDAAIRNQGASIKTFEIQIGQMSKLLQEKGFGSLLGSTETNPRDHVKSISITVESEMPLICHIGPTRYTVSSPQNSVQLFKPNQSIIPFPSQLIDTSYEEKSRMDDEIKASMNVHILAILEDALPPKEKDLGSELAINKLIIKLADRIVKLPKGLAENVLVGIGRRPFLSTAHAKIDVFKRKIALKVGNHKIVFKSDNPTSNIIKKVYVLELRERMKLDLEARLMGNFSVVTDFVVMKNMDAYRDKDMGDVIVGKPFCRALCVEARRFNGFITIHDGNDNVTYQMAQSHLSPRFAVGYWIKASLHIFDAKDTVDLEHGLT
ncbi:hypothetical protein Tco_0378631 [Tanacetum coccineum]